MRRVVAPIDRSYNLHYNNSMKKCCICKDIKEEACFDRNRTKKDGLAGYCKDCNRTRMREYYHKNKDKMRAHRLASKARSRRRRLTRYRELMGQKSCARCGLTDPRVLDWHHKDPGEKVTEVSQLALGNWGRLLEEIEKCVPLCRNCHAIVHYEERHRKLDN
jgi:hypothetical protein